MGIMNELAEVLAFLVPDFLALGVGASVFFGVYCGARTLGLFETQGTDWSLVFSLLLGYAAAVAFNLACSLASPPSARVSGLSRLNSVVGPAVPIPSAPKCSSKTPCRPHAGRVPTTGPELQPVRARLSEAASAAGPRHSG